MSQFGIRYAEGLKVLPLLAPQDIVATATASQYYDLNLSNWLTIVVPFGNVASTDSTGGVAVTVEASTAGSSNATEGAIAFQYRLSAAVATDSMGAITSATTAGMVVTEADDNKVLIIDIDPSAVAVTADRRFVRVVLTPTAEVTAPLVGGVLAIAEPRYPGNAIPSST